MPEWSRRTAEHGVFELQDRMMAQEKDVAEMETAAMLLDEYEQQLDNIGNQAMLLLGFVMATIGVDGLTLGSDPTSVYCYSKSSGHFAVTLFVVVATELCIVFCVLSIAGAAQTRRIGRDAYLHIGWLISVYRVKSFLDLIYKWFALAGACFLASTILLLWLFVGVQQHVLADEEVAFHSDAYIVTNGGRTLLEHCMNTADDEQARTHARSGRNTP